jgi:Tol biopolymer transport system component
MRRAFFWLTIFLLTSCDFFRLPERSNPLDPKSPFYIELKRLTSGREKDNWPAWSPSGEEIAFSRQEAEGWNIYIIHLPTQSLRKVTPVGENLKNFKFPQYRSPRELLFTAEYLGVEYIYALNLDNLDTSKIEQIVYYPLSPNRGFCLGGAGEIIFVPETGGIWSITKEEVRFLVEMKDVFYPQYSISAQRLLFISPAEGNLYQLPLFSESQPKRLFLSPFSETTGSWSPNGKEIVFSSNRAEGQNYSLWLATSEGKIKKRLTFDTANDSFPVFSPSGKEIAFVSDRGGYQKIWLCYLPKK